MTPKMGTRLGNAAGSIGFAELRGALADFGQRLERHIEQGAEFLVPAQFANVEQEGAAGVGVVGGKNLSAGEPVNEIGVNRADDGLATFESGGKVRFFGDEPFEF